MIEFTPELALKLWYRAAREELGIRFNVDAKSTHTVKRDLYEARRDINDPRLEMLKVHFSADGTEVIIYKDATGRLER